MSAQDDATKARIEDKYAQDTGPDISSDSSQAGMMTIAFCDYIPPSIKE